jgi:hypothetical protein
MLVPGSAGRVGIIQQLLLQLLPRCVEIVQVDRFQRFEITALPDMFRVLQQI